MYEILDKITSGHGEMEDIIKLETLGNVIKNTALCGLGQTAPNPVLSTVHYFYDEYLAHIVDKNCPSKACKALLKYSIDEKNALDAHFVQGYALCIALSPNPKQFMLLMQVNA